MIFGGVLASYGQSIVTANQQYKSVILEELTGIHCTYCPDGHVRAQGIKDNNPGRVVLINIHAGSYAVPSAGEPDYRTPDGDAIDALADPSGYPAGSINRQVFAASDNNTAMGRGSWEVSANSVLAELSPVNVGATTSYNAGTREITIDVEAYYTANSPAATNYIHIALLQDTLLGPQIGGTTYNPTNYIGPDYVHSHMLKDMITPLWGDAISTTTLGALYTNQYVYTIPADVNGEIIDPTRCNIAVFVSETQENIYTGIELDIDGGANTGNSAPYYGGFSNLNPAVLEGVIADTSDFSFNMNSALAGANDFVFQLTSNVPVDWDGYYSVDGTDHFATDTISITGGTPANILIRAIPGTTKAVGSYTMTMWPLADPTATSSQQVYVIFGITDLIVSGTGSWGDGGSYNWDQEYRDGLTFATNTAFDVTSAYVMKEAQNSNALTGVNNLYMNIAWTFPSFTDDEATAMMAFMDNGGNVFVAGQDIGWDIMSGAGNGNAVTQNLFTNYFNSTYVADGAAANNQLTAVAADGIFGTVANSAIVDMYGGNIYPEELTPINGASAIFNYNGNAAKTGGVRFTNGTYKMVYMGIGMEMVQTVAVKDEIIKLAHDWFYGLITGVEMDAELNDGVVLYPNPSNGKFNLNITKDGKYDVTVLNLVGKVVFETQVNKIPSTTTIDLSNVASGVYLVKLNNGKEIISKKIVKE